MVLSDLSTSLTLKDKVYIDLKEQIVKGNLGPGERLNELEISKAMNISRGPIREALNMLVKDGFADMIPRKGAIVSDFTKEQISDIWEMRKVLEPYAAKYAIENLSDKELEEIRNRLNSFLDNPADMDEYVELDLGVHALIYKSISNKYMKQTLLTMRDHSMRMRYCAEKVENERKNVIIKSTLEHVEIVEALIRRSESEASAKILNHIVNSEERTVRSLRDEYK